MKKTIVGLVVAIFIVSIFAVAVFSSEAEELEAVVGNEGQGNLEDAAEVEDIEDVEIEDAAEIEDVEVAVGNEGQGNLEDDAVAEEVEDEEVADIEDDALAADKEKKVEFSKTTTDDLGSTSSVSFEREIKVDDGMKEAKSELEVETGNADGSSATIELGVSLEDAVITVDLKKTMTTADGVTTTKEVTKEFTDKEMALHFIHKKLAGTVLPPELISIIHHK